MLKTVLDKENENSRSNLFLNNICFGGCNFDHKDENIDAFWFSYLQQLQLLIKSSMSRIYFEGYLKHGSATQGLVVLFSHCQLNSLFMH